MRRKSEIDVSGLPEEAVQAVESVVSLLRPKPKSKESSVKMPKDLVLGLFRDQPELLDQIVEEAMKARETRSLRLPRE